MTTSDHQSARIVGDWVVAGIGCGTALGAAFGGLLLLLAGPLGTIFGALLGAVVGMVAGLGFGLLDGAALACAARTAILGTTAAERRRRTTLIAVLLTGSIGVGGPIVLLHGSTAPLSFLLCLPGLIGVAVAASLSDTLPPAGPGRRTRSCT